MEGVIQQTAPSMRASRAVDHGSGAQMNDSTKGMKTCFPSTVLQDKTAAESKKRRCIKMNTSKVKPGLSGNRNMPPEINKWVSKARRLPAIRKDLVERVRREIAAGEYETPEKLASAIERMIQEEFE